MDLPPELLKLCSEDSTKEERVDLDLKQYCSALKNMKIPEDGVAMVVKDHILSAAFHPCTSSLLMAAGDKLGRVGLWNLTHKEYEKYSMCQRLHKVYFVVADTTMVRTFDSRFLRKTNSEPVCQLHGHSLSIFSAYFSSTTGNRVLTSCMDNRIRIYNTSSLISNAPLVTSIGHNLKNGLDASKLAAVWDPKQEDCLVVGNMDRPRRVQVYHESGQLLHSFRDADRLTTVLSVTAFHPSRNALLGGDAAGSLHVFTH